MFFSEMLDGWCFVFFFDDFVVDVLCILLDFDFGFEDCVLFEVVFVWFY